MLVDYLVKQNWLQTPRIVRAFRKVNRADFLPEEFKSYAEMNQVFPIGWGKTIVQPLVAAFMLERLQPRNGDVILEVGAGSGWMTAILLESISQASESSQTSSKKGKVIALEAIPDLKELALKNVSKYGFVEKGLAEFFCADGSKGYPLMSGRTDLANGFDKIISSIPLKELPAVWKKQLKVGGTIVARIGESIWQFVKVSEDKFEENEFPGISFMSVFDRPQMIRV